MEDTMLPRIAKGVCGWCGGIARSKIIRSERSINSLGKKINLFLNL